MRIPVIACTRSLLFGDTLGLLLQLLESFIRGIAFASIRLDL